MNYLDVNFNHGEEDYELNFHTTNYDEFCRVFELCKKLVDTHEDGHKIMVSDDDVLMELKNLLLAMNTFSSIVPTRERCAAISYCINEILGGVIPKVSDKKIRKAMEVLNKEYENACKLDYVNNPLAFALYQTWRKYDSYYKESEEQDAKKIV